jgi:hypothetical protein
MVKNRNLVVSLFLALALPLAAQDTAAPDTPTPERWNL